MVVYMFWGDGCPHCAAAKPIFEDFADKYPEVELRFFEIRITSYNVCYTKLLRGQFNTMVEEIIAPEPPANKHTNRGLSIQSRPIRMGRASR